ncbi:MAG: CZB domain-containing protein [Rhodospirillaceae bacterium]
MQTKQRQITEAAAAHRIWEESLRTAITSGRIGGIDILKIGRDDQCTFGKWLKQDDIHSIIPSPEQYREICTLHQQFHHCVAHVLELLTEGRQAEASAMMAADGAYTRASETLLAALAALGPLV